MPFTISHIAAVLPAHQQLRRWGFFSAAIVGTMVPDFGFLLPVPLTRAATHSAVALFTFSLPTGLLAFWTFQLLIKPAWCVVLPGSWRVRLRAEHPAARLGDWRAWLGAAAAVLAGAITHLVWDAFTHEDGRGVQMLPFLEGYGPDIEGHTLHLYRWLQHASSVVGLLLVAWAAWRWSHGEIRGDLAGAEARGRWLRSELGAAERHTWLAAYLLIPAMLLLVSALLGLDESGPSIAPGPFLTRLAFVGLGGSGLSLLLVSALIRLRVAWWRRPLDA
jgi:Domain of unknown function (DUF4184)